VRHTLSLRAGGRDHFDRGKTHVVFGLWNILLRFCLLRWNSSAGDLDLVADVGRQICRGRYNFFAADLVSDAGCREAVAGCDYVMHVASAIPGSAPKHEDELIIPAREGTLRVPNCNRTLTILRVAV
jgi:hypothetical protein